MINQASTRQFVSAKINKFLFSEIYLIAILLIGALGFAFRLEKYAMGLLIIIATFNFIAIKDTMPNFAVLVIIAMTPLARHGEAGYFYSLPYLIPLPIIGLIIHFILYPPRPNAKTFLYPSLAVAVAITLGGLFSPTFIKSFQHPALFYVLTLGVIMVGVYLFLESYIDKEYDYKEYLCKIMTIIGLMGIVMVISNYIRYQDLVNISISQLIVKFQFGNNLSNMLLISMPFTFYLSTKSKYSTFYFTIGVLQYFAMIFSFSRGGIVFATFILPFILVATLYYDKKHRSQNVFAFLLIVTIVLLLIYFVAINIGERIIGEIQVDGDEARVNLYKHAWQMFLKYPVFGTGLGYIYPDYYLPEAWCIYWYHSTVFQILGSLGIFGVICYGYQYLIRLKTIIKINNPFNIFVFLSFAGFEAYSLVNVGVFAPLPYMPMLLLMFIILDRNNNIIKMRSPR